MKPFSRNETFILEIWDKLWSRGIHNYFIYLSSWWMQCAQTVYLANWCHLSDTFSTVNEEMKPDEHKRDFSLTKTKAYHLAEIMCKKGFYYYYYYQHWLKPQKCKLWPSYTRRLPLSTPLLFHYSHRHSSTLLLFGMSGMFWSWEEYLKLPSACLSLDSMLPV